MLDSKKAQSKWNRYWFKTRWRWRSCSVICKSDRAPHRHVFWSWFGSCLAIAAYLTAATHSPLLMAPFGATSVLIFGVPDSPLAQPRNVIGGSVISALVSLVALQLFGAAPFAIGLCLRIEVKLYRRCLGLA
jgi:CBS-domain-containing membrane protein